MKIIDFLHSKRNEKVQEGTFPYLEISDIDVNSKKYSFKDKTSVLGAVYAHKNNILVSTVRPTRGAITIVKENEIPVSNAFAILNVNDKICLPKYLFYSINNKVFLDYLGKNSKGATYPTCSKEDIYNYNINYVDYSRQNEIVKTFDNISRQIEIKTNQLEDYDQLIKSQFVEMFVDKYEKIQVSTKLRTTSGGTPKSDQSEYYANGTIPWLTSGEVNQGRIEKTEKFITEKGLTNSSAKWIPKKSIVIAMYGATAGKVGIIEIPTTTNQAVCAVLPHDEYNPEYLRFAFEYISEELAGKAVGGGQPNISQAIIKDSLIFNPPLEVQKKFSAFVQHVDKLKFTVQQSLNETQQLFNSLMQEYFGQEVAL